MYSMFNFISMPRDIVLQANLYILHNVNEIELYLSTKKRAIKEKYHRMSDKWLLKEYNNNFISWFNKRIYSDDNESETFKWLSYLPKFNVVTWTAYDISNFPFYIKSKDERSTIQNSEIMFEAESMFFSS